MIRIKDIPTGSKRHRHFVDLASHNLSAAGQPKSSHSKPDSLPWQLPHGKFLCQSLKPVTPLAIGQQNRQAAAIRQKNDELQLRGGGLKTTGLFSVESPQLLSAPLLKV